MSQNNTGTKTSDRWVSIKTKQPVKKGFYSIKGLNNQGRPVKNNGIWFTGKFWMVREGCIVTHWEHEEPQPPTKTSNQ